MNLRPHRARLWRRPVSRSRHRRHLVGALFGAGEERRVFPPHGVSRWRWRCRSACHRARRASRRRSTGRPYLRGQGTASRTACVSTRPSFSRRRNSARRPSAAEPTVHGGEAVGEPAGRGRSRLRSSQGSPGEGERRVMWFHSENRSWHATRGAFLEPDALTAHLRRPARAPAQARRRDDQHAARRARPEPGWTDHTLALPPRLRRRRQAWPRTRGDGSCPAGSTLSVREAR